MLMWSCVLAMTEICFCWFSIAGIGLFLMVWYGIYFPYKNTIHNRNMSFKKTAGFALLSKHLQSIAVFQRGPVNN